MWLKDNAPVTKRVTVSNSDGSSQLLIPSSERSDSGIYSIVVKNLAGQETFSIEVRVTGKARLQEGILSFACFHGSASKTGCGYR